jgi:two-component system OmpR family sensor kinase
LNKAEKKSYYAFVALYLVSSFILIGISAFWYYRAQKNALENLFYYKMQHAADQASSAVIRSHMKDAPLQLPPLEKEFTLALLDTEGRPMFGTALGVRGVDLSQDFYRVGDLALLVSSGTNMHRGVRHVVIASPAMSEEIALLRSRVSATLVAAFAVIALVGFFLSRLFLQPIHRKVEEIERFIKDITHELNTPITALKMSTRRAIEKRRGDERTLRNISISTKQLYNIYSALTYLSFSSSDQEEETVDLDAIVRSSVAYFEELASSKQITLHYEGEATPFLINGHKAAMLFNNLIGNAIKYSHPETTVTMRLKDRLFVIEDEGIGIDKEKLSAIFTRFKRGTDYAGGFGMGLDIVRTIAKEYNIHVDVASEPDKGSVFTLRFPHQR